MIALAVALALAAPAQPAPSRVLVEATEFRFTLSRTTVKPGPAIVQLAIRGEDPHDLALRRTARGARTYSTPEVLPGGERTISLRLYPGRYQLWCTIADHRARGMRATLTVTK